MSHTALQGIRQRLESTRRRQNLSLAATYFGIWLLACSLLFVLLVSLGAAFGAAGIAWQWLFAAFAIGVFATTFTLAWRFILRWQSSRHFVHDIEQRLPELEQRLITSLEFENRNDPGVSPQFIQRLFEDASARVSSRPLNAVVSFKPAGRALGFACAALVGTGVLILLSETFQHASRQLALSWQNDAVQREESGLAVAVHVQPGSVAMQRGDDLTVTASLDNASSDQLVLYVQDDKVNWQRISMAPENGQPESGAKIFSTRIPQLSQDLVYYVEYRSGSGGGAQVVRSPQYRVNLFDLPRVDALEVAYDFPGYTGLQRKVDNPGGDIVAPQGTTITLNATVNKQVKAANLIFSDGENIPLQIADKQLSGSFQVSEDTNYRIELTDADDKQNRNPAEYYVRAVADREPKVALRAPGRDKQVMPLEEVAIAVNAEDDYGLERFELVYSVVGGEQKTIDFLDASSSRKAVTGETLVYLEDLQVQPGDVVSYSVTAKDNNAYSGPAQVVSDIYFLEVIPTDHEFSRARSGGGGGGGGGGGDASALVKTQKDVIAATWKLRNREGKVDDQSFAEDGRIIRDSQAEVAQRAQMSISRLTERGTFDDDNYQRAVEALQRAITEMEAAVQSLDELSLATALESEQRALQAVMQAEAQVNKSQVAMNRSGGGGGGGQGGEREDLRELFEMEMGELENRYELPQQQADQRNQPQNETLDKLKELARRQEQLTRSQRELARRENEMEEEQKRRQLEKLRREQEELRQQLQQLAQSMQESQQQAGQSQSKSQSSRSNGQGGSRSERDQRMDQLQQAMEQMQQAASSESPSQAAAKSQKALDSLRRQAEELDQQGQQSVADLQKQVKERAEQLVRDQRELRRMVEEKSRSESLSNTRSQTRSSGATEELLEQQRQLREGMDAMRRDLRDIATRAGDDQQRALQEAHDVSRALRPIQEKMDTSQQILERGMLNLSLKIESDIETELADLQRRIQSMGNTPGGPDGNQESEQVAQQVKQLRESLEELQRQVERQQPEELAQRRGERSGAGDQAAAERDGQRGAASRSEMQDSLERSRELAQGLAQLGLGGQSWSGSARSIRTQLTQQGLEEFLSRPELLKQLLAPVVELEKQLRVQAELSEIDNKLFSAADEDVPEEYRALVESYYKELSESRSAENQSR